MTQELTSHPTVRQADVVNDASRQIARFTLGAQLPAPLVYDILGNLKGVGHLQQALVQLAQGLGRSLDEFDVYESDGADPGERAAEATDHLLAAAELAKRLAAELELAQNAIARQGYLASEDMPD
ncbi:hypothetical protein [Agromyces humi]|uniref:hypothetical protein n=1 Tax=Agromyces humi TaxID=1766800 RepID=UPI00135BD85B|nr:hypothetical protein [Agromyces humi]